MNIFVDFSLSNYCSVRSKTSTFLLGWAKNKIVNYEWHKVVTCPSLVKGAWEVDQQWIISGAKQCYQHLNKKNGLKISFFLEQTEKNTDLIPKKVTHFIFGNETYKATLSNYNIQGCSSCGSIYLWYNHLVLHLFLSWLKKLHLLRLTGAAFNLACIKTKVLLPQWKDDYMKIFTSLRATALILVDFS